MTTDHGEREVTVTKDRRPKTGEAARHGDERRTDTFDAHDQRSSGLRKLMNEEEGKQEVKASKKS